LALPTTARTPAGCSPPDRVMPMTSCPRLIASVAIRLPTIPLAPYTAIFMNSSPLVDGHNGVDGNHW
jgi:hypothetical protein